MDKNHAAHGVWAGRLLRETGKVIVGKERVLLWVAAALLAGGHILLEDVPGVGKTTLALALSRALELDCSRMQFTPDVLPSDVTGYSVLTPAGDTVYRPGAVLCNLFLADELNRASSRTQSALLEAIEEGQVTVDGVSHPIPKPFTVIATQNPPGASGTQPLPDSQMDRFLIRLSLGYPTAEDERAIVRDRLGRNPLDDVARVSTREELIALRQQTAATYMDDAVVDYLVRLIAATRSEPLLSRGASPRGTLALASLSRAVARLRGRDYTVPSDVQEAFPAAIAHRVVLTAAAQADGVSPEALLKNILERTAAPRLR